MPDDVVARGSRSHRGLAASVLVRPEALAILAGVILPNAIYIAGFLGDFAAPPRTATYFLYLFIVILSRYVRRRTAFLAFLGVLAADIFWTVAMAFRLPPGILLRSLEVVADLNITGSPVYLTLIACVAFSTGGSLFILMRYRDAVRQASLVPATVTALAFGATDIWVNAHASMSPLGVAPPPANPLSATQLSGFERAVLAPGSGNALLVVVESLGAFADPAHQELLLGNFTSPALRAAYDITTGTAPYHGSTTAGELRELCLTSQPYAELTTESAANCLPNRLARLGRRTVALHGYTERMFDRLDWYPTVGFQRMLFAEQLGGSMERRCGSVFAGMCDTEIAARLPMLLPSRPEGRFTYWLTLNSHVPVRPGDAKPRFDCDTSGGAFGHLDVCRMAEIWAEVIDSVADIARDPKAGPLEVLIVGDHAPPLWSRHGRRLFRPGEVPWIRLAPRRDAADTAATLQPQGASGRQ